MFQTNFLYHMGVGSVHYCVDKFDSTFLKDIKYHGYIFVEKKKIVEKKTVIWF